LFPILLSDEIIPNAIFYGTVAPLLGYYCLKVFIINPFNKRQEEKDKQKLRNANSAKMAEKRKEAESVIALMREAFSRIVERETEKSGLVIVKAIYGNQSVINEYSDDERLIPLDSEAFEVTIPLQCLVNNDSTLSLTNASKSQLPGFYDPNLGEAKHLFIRYKYKDKLHEIIIDDLESVSLPSEG
jgi:DnaJ family protein C protein 11